MSLLAAVNQPNKDAYYFALDSTPVDPTVTAPDFEATGGAGSVPAGVFSSLGDSPAGGSVSFSMAKPDKTAQWGIGMANVPGGANSGNDFAIYSYSDTGAFLGAPLEIDRSSGLVTIGTDLTVVQDIVAESVAATQTVSAGLPATVGGGSITVNGTLGVSQVFDPTYNPPSMGTDTLLVSQTGDGTIITNVPYTPTQSGTYVLSATVVAVGSGGYTWNTNSNSMMWGLTYNGGVNIVSGGQIYVAGLVNPTGRPAIGPLQPNTTEFQTDILVELTAGLTYQIQYGATGPAFDIGVGLGGGVGIAIAKLIT